MLMMLALVVLAYLSLLGWGAHLGYRQVDQSHWLIQIDQVATSSIRTGVATGMERGITALALSESSRASATLREEVIAERRRVDDCFAQIQSDLNTLTASGRMPALQQQVLRLQDTHRVLLESRKKADRALDGALAIEVDEWVNVSSEFIDALADLHLAVRTFGSPDEQLRHRIALIQDALFTAAEYAGRERVLLSSSIAAGRPVSSEPHHWLTRTRGVVEGLGPHLDELLQVGRINTAWQRVQSIFLGEYQLLRQSVYAAGNEQPSPVNSEGWFRESTQAINTLVDLSDALAAYTRTHLQATASQAMRSFLWLAATGAGLLLLVTGLVVLLYIRAVHPLKQLEEAAEKISAGDFSASLALTQQDELGQTTRAIERMRQHLVETTRQREIANRLLQNSERRLRDLIENVADWVWEVDLEGVYTYSSPQSRDILGYEPEELLGKTPFDLMPPDEAQRMRAFYARLLQSPVTVNQVVNLNQHKDGKLVWIESAASPVYSEEHLLIGYRGNDRDITARVAAEEKLRKMAQVLEQTDDLVIITDRQGRIEHVNPSFENHTGYTLSEVAGQSPGFLKSRYSSDVFNDGFWEKLASGEVIRLITTNKKKDGTLYTENKTITPIRDSRGAITHYVSTGKDITAERDMEQQLRHHERMASIGLLSAGIAHEINNPMSYVNANLALIHEYASQLLEFLTHNECYIRNKADIPTPDPTLPEEERLGALRNELESLFQESADGISRVKTIVQGLNDYAHPSTDDWQQADINQQLDRSLQLMAHRIPDSIRIVKDYASLPTVRCIPRQIDQVIMNLLLNGVQAIDNSGSIELRTREDAGEVCIEIRDSGHGMDEATMGQIFNPFFTTKPQGEGTGLGLHMAWRVIEKHQGTIEVESEPGQGSVFRIRLPNKQP